MALTHELWLTTSLFSLGIAGLSLHRTHFLSALLCLESMMISIFIGFSLWTLNLSLSTPMMIPIIILTFSACDAGLGLALMIATARTHGTDNLNTMNLLQC